MAAPNIARFQLKRDTTANWLKSTVKLQSGELGYDFNKKELRVGNGNQLWQDLPSIGSGSGGISSTIAINSPTISVSDVNLNISYSGPNISAATVKVYVKEAGLYSTEVVKVENVPITSTTSEIPIPINTFYYNSSYKFEIFDGAIKLGELEDYKFLPTITFAITPSVSSHQGIGVSYVYTGNNIKFDVFVKQGGTTISEKLANTLTGNGTGILYVTKGSDYSNGQYDITVSCEGTIIATSNNFAYTLPTLAATLSDSNNKQINLTLSSGFPNASLSCAGNSITVGPNIPSSLTLSNFPTAGTTLSLVSTFTDGKTITIPLPYNRSASLTSVQFVNLTTIKPSITFTGVSSVIFNFGTYSQTIPTTQCTSSFVGGNTVYTYNSDINLTSTYGQTRIGNVTFGGQTTTSSSYSCVGAFSPTTIGIPFFTGNSNVSIPYLSWIGVSLTGLTVQLRSGSSTLASSTFDTISYSISFDYSLIPGTTYYIRVVFPNSSFIDSTASTLEPIMVLTSKNAASISFQWSTYTFAKYSISSCDSVGTIISEVKPEVTIPKPAGAITATLPTSTNFIYNEYYLVTYSFSTSSGGIYTSPVNSFPVRYQFSGLVLTNVPVITDTYSASTRLVTTNITISVPTVPGDNRLKVYLYKTDSPSTKLTNFVADVTLLGGTPIATPLDAGPTVYYYTACVMPDAAGAYNIIIVTSPNALYNPSRGTIQVTNFGDSPNPSATFTRSGPTTNVSFSVLNGTSFANIYSSGTIATPTSPYVFSGYTLPIQRSSLTLTPYRFSMNLLSGGGGVSRSVFWPAIGSNPVTYDYDDTPAVSNITGRTNIENNNGKTLRYQIRWKGFATTGILQLYTASNTFIQTIDSDVTLDNYRTASNLYPEVPNSSLTNVLTSANYYLRLYLGTVSGPFIQSDQFSYTASTCVIQVTEATTTTVSATFTWSGNPVSNRIIKLISSDSSNEDALSSVRVGSSTNSAVFTLTNSSFFTAPANGTTFYLSLQLPTQATSNSNTFTYAPLSYSSPTMVFRNTPGAGGEQGVLYITATVAGPSDRKIVYTLTEFDFSTGGSGTTVQTTGAIATGSSTSHEYTFSSSNFSFNKWYNVSYVLSSDFSNSTTYSAIVISTRLQYVPKGYDILVFSGQSNMGGRDNIPSSAQAWTAGEKNTGITYRSGVNAKKVVTSTTGAVGIPSLTNAVAPFTGREDDIRGTANEGVTLAYDFSNFYANNSLASNRDLIIVYEIRGGTGIAEATNGWIGTVHRTYDALVNATEFAGEQTVALTAGEYSRNRVSAFLWHQGEADRTTQDYISKHITLLNNFTTESALTTLKLFKGSLNAIVGNIDVTHNCKITNSGFGNIMALLDSYESLNTSPNFNVKSVSSFGLRCIDQDGNFAADLQASVHFNARSERLFGRRYFNAYLDLIGVSNPALEASEVFPPSVTTDGILTYNSYDVAGNGFSSIGRFAFNSSANSYIYSRNVIGYLITASLATTSIYSIFTEYNTTNGQATATEKTCYLPYFINNNDYAMVHGTTVTPGIDIATNRYAFTPYILDSSYENPSRIYEQTLTGNIGDFIREKIEPYLRTTYTGGTVSSRVTSKLTLSINGIIVNLGNCNTYAVSAGNVGTDVSNEVVVLTLPGGFSDIQAGDIISTKGVTSPEIINGIISGADAASRRIAVSTNLVSGTGASTITSIGSGTAIIYRANYTITPAEFLPPFFGLRLNETDLPVPTATTTAEYPLSSWDSVTSARPVSGKLGGSGTPSVLVAGLVDTTSALTSTSDYRPGGAGGTLPSPNASSWRLLGSPSDMWNTTSVLNPLVFSNRTTWTIQDGNDNGVLVSRIAKDTEWYLFFSKGKVTTTSRTPSGSSVGLSRSGTANDLNHASGTQFYATQLSGITFDGNILFSGSLMNILNSSYEPPVFFFYNTGSGFTFRLRNVIPNKVYKISYYISVRTGRVPHNNTLLTPLGTGSVDNADFYLSNPLPVRVYAATPTASNYLEFIGDTTVIGQDVHFGVGTNTPAGSQVSTQPVQTHLHTSSSSSWTGAWKYSEFRFRMPNIIDPGYANYAYLQFGPLPTTRLGFNNLTNIQTITSILMGSTTISLRVPSTSGYAVGDRITTSGLAIFSSTTSAANLTSVLVSNIYAGGIGILRTQESVVIDTIAMFPAIYNRANTNTLLNVTGITTSSGTTTLTVTNTLAVGDYIYSLGITPAICYAQVTARTPTTVQIASGTSYALTLPTIGKVGAPPDIRQSEYINTGFGIGGISCTIDNT